MVNIVLLMVGIILTTIGTCFANTVIQAEIPTAVELSNTDINRIVCPGPLSDLIFSEEKGMTGHFSGNNGYIKFKIEDAGNDYLYADTQSELFVVCNSSVYTLLVTPEHIPSVTLRLAPPTGDSYKQNIAHYQKMPLEKQAIQLIRESYNDTYPTSYKITTTSKTIFLPPDLEAQLLQIVDVDGVGLRLNKYLVTSNAEKQLELNEQIFLSSAISQSILAIAVQNHTLYPHQSTQVFIVSQKEQVK